MKQEIIRFDHWGQKVYSCQKKHRATKKKIEQQLPTDNNQELNTEQYMNKKLIRLTEQDLHKIVKESVDKILKEMDLNPRMNNFDAYGRRLISKSRTPNSPRSGYYNPRTYERDETKESTHDEI